MTTGTSPKPTPLTAPFWEGTKEHELRVQRCNTCERFFFYPRSSCRYCQSTDVEWRRVSGKAKLASFIINRKPVVGTEPQIIALVDLAEGPRMLTNVIDVEPEPANLRLGMSLHVKFVDREDMVLPMFVIEEER
jgi:uncharacterized OB-fold protein